ncbi:MAG: protein kinase [Candidatus Woesearchaeota archaeon]
MVDEKARELASSFSKGNIKPVVRLTDTKKVLEQKIRNFEGKQMEELGIDDFKFSDIFKHENVARKNFGIGMERRDYALLEDLPQKMDALGRRGALSIPLAAVNPQDDKDRIQMILPNLAGSGMSREGLGKLLNRFENESTLITRLDSQHIINALGVVPAKIGSHLMPIFGIATEYLEETHTLRQILDAALMKRYRFTPEEVIALAQPIASSLRMMHNDSEDMAPYRDVHREEMVHRGPEPSAYLVSRYGRMVLFDFTLARLFPKVEPKNLRHAATTIEMLPDEPRYLSWEQTNTDPKKLKGVSDCQTAGIVLYELMVMPDAESPFVELYDKTSVLRQVEENKYVPISRFADKKVWTSKGKDKIDLRTTVDDCMKQMPADRLNHVEVRGGVYHCAARLDEELKGFAEQKPLPALLDENQIYSEKRAEQVRSQVIQNLFGA